MYNHIILLILTVSLVANGVFIYQNSQDREAQDDETALTEEQVNQKLYPFLSKRIFTSNNNDILINFIPLREALKEYVGKQGGRVGVYFEYLPSGTSIGVNDQLEIKFVSLIKIPVVMAVYKRIESGEIRKDEILTLRQEDIDSKYGELWKKGAGAKLPIMEAVNLSLVQSDNTATNALIHRVGLRAIQDVFDGLDVPRDTDTENVLVISPKNYSSILRSLYLSSYLHEENSNEIISILTKTAFKDKLPAGVPANILVAHKIGVFDQRDKQDKVYSDCGIIYVPDRPYSLCAFVLDTDEKAKEHITYISKMVYGYVASVKGGK